MNVSAGDAVNDDTIELVELKRKNYRLSKKIKNVDSQQEEVLLGQANSQTAKNCDKLDSNVNDIDSAPRKKMSKNNLWQKVDNLLELNVKFESSELENAFKSSYLGVSRSIYIKYLLYLIAFTLTWLIFLIVNNQGQIDVRLAYATIIHYGTHSNFTMIAKSNEPTTANLNDNKFLLLSCMLVVCLIYIIIFVFLAVIEYQEDEFRKIEKKLSRQEHETKVNFKLAEKDLKLAMEEVLEKERQYHYLRKKHEQDSVTVNRLRDMYKKCSYSTAIVVTILMFGLCFMLFFIQRDTIFVTQASHFVWFAEAVLLLYLVYPFQLLLPLTLGICLSVAFEYLSMDKQLDAMTNCLSSKLIFASIKALLHTCLHLVSVYLKLCIDSIKRDTFIKLAHMNKAHMTSQQDKQITERMIKSIMPPLFTHVFGKPEEFKKNVNRVDQMRPLFIYPVSQISILFADIVGFTRMSSNKTAQELVYLLNDLYARFDRLCEQAGCEKISTLGDCYYCVSGCLNGRSDHAKCSVEMGLLMVKEIEAFNRDHDVDVNMRVGVHTGSALCGFIGGKRFRFDVWSSDVTLANKMESSGRAGWVHISEDTYKQLNGKFNTEPGENQSGKATYFVVRESKRETVADALKLSETQNSRRTADQAAGQPNNTMQLLTNDNRQHQLSSMDEQRLLTLAVKKTQFVKPETNFFTMRFDSDEEADFQTYLMGLSNSTITDTTTNNMITKNTKKINSLFTIPRNLLHISVLMAFVINACVSSAYFLSFIACTIKQFKYSTIYTARFTSHFISVVVTFCLIFLLQIGLLIGYFILNRGKSNLTLPEEQKMCRNKLKKKVFINQTLVYALSSILLTLVPIYLLGTGLPFVPTINSHLSNNSLIDSDDQTSNINSYHRPLNLFGLYLYFTYTICLVSFVTFVQLSSLYRTCLALVFAAIIGLCALLGIDSTIAEHMTGPNSNLSATNEPVATSPLSFYSSMFLKGFLVTNTVTLIDFGLLLVLIWLINRHSELMQRISFKYDQESLMKITNAKEQKDLANWLIDIVIPSHVISYVKEKKQYSMNYECVGVLFVSLCNFSEFFEESYEGGRELLRVLNEISIDFDRLLDEPKYNEIEKIKSIGSTFMIASGLKLDNKTSNMSHLYDLVDFALEMKEKLESFNLEAMSVCHFKFQMKMGFNCGPLTAGVIGTDRLLYDIWGDTVNVASRMDSTGQAGLLQAPEKAAKLLQDQYKFYQRGMIQIKGKDKMMTYFLDPNENRKRNQN